MIDDKGEPVPLGAILTISLNSGSFSTRNKVKSAHFSAWASLLPAKPYKTTMNQDDLKRMVAKAAIDYVIPRIQTGEILGIGTGTTANCFIELLGQHKHCFAATVASSNASEERLRAQGIKVVDLNEIDRIAFYVDGADESNHNLQLIKGGGAALTREKIVTACSDVFVCIADESKWVNTLGKFPLPVEVIPMAREYVARELRKLGGEPIHRAGVLTDNGCDILDVHGLKIADPANFETRINQITGVVTNGLFALRPADVLLLGTQERVEIVRP